MRFPHFFAAMTLALSALGAQAQTSPSITSVAFTTFNVGQANNFTVTATGSPAPAFSATGLPLWASLNSTTGVLSGTPPDTTGSPFIINLTVANGTTPNATQTFTLTAGVSLNTTPEGVVTYSLPATSLSNPTSYFSAPLTNDPVYTGAVSVVGTNTITIPDLPTPWTTNQFASASAPYFVKFLSGLQSGRVLLVTANTSNALTLDTSDHSIQTVALTASNFSVAVGDAFEVFPGDTLGLLFGVNTTQIPLILKGAPAALNADAVSVYSPFTSLFRTYYFDTGAGFWKLIGTSANANNTILYPYSTFLITRRSNEPALTFSLMGRVPEVSRLVKAVGTSTAVYDSTGYPVDMTLSQLQLGNNWTKGPSALVADTVGLWNATLFRFDAYFQLSDSTWRKVQGGTVDRSSFVIPAGTTVIFVKRTTASGATSYLQPVLPYSLN